MDRGIRAWCITFGFLLSLPVESYAGGDGPRVEETLDLCRVWSGHRVGFCLLTEGQNQYAAFYDQDRHMTVAKRDVNTNVWQFKRLGSVLGWDSHNYVTMSLDDRGHLHVSGNMHVHPLVYFRTDRPGDIESLRPVSAMVGSLEERCTYPRFIDGPGGEMIFTYRDGGSGRGNQIYNIYDSQTRLWRRLLDQPLLDGRGLMNAYPVGPTRGADGVFDLCWVWRDTSDCSTNHDVSYARSKDLVHWETVAGEPIALPITLETSGVVVDPVPAGGGVINGNTRVGFDRQRRPILTYHKFDAEGKTQVYNARYEAGRWVIYQVSDWDYRWVFQGGGTIHFEVRVSAVKVHSDGSLRQKYSHAKYGPGVWELDEVTLRPVREIEAEPQWPAALTRPESDYPGMGVRWSGDTGGSGEARRRYVLRWESLGVNRDRGREKIPPASMLRLYKLKD
jgi:putative BNR repeat neuraminidase